MNLYLLSGLLLISCSIAAISCGERVSQNSVQHFTRNQVELVAEQAGNGPITLVFVHGWGINRSYWNAQVNALRNSYRIVTIDLAGFGESGKNRQDWTVEAYEKDLSYLMEKMELEKVVLIGHSMSGAIVLETALENQDKVLGIIGVDNFRELATPLSAETKKEWDRFYALLSTRFSSIIREEMSAYLFADSTPTSIREKVIKDMTAADSLVAVPVLKATDQYAFSEKLPLYKKKLCLVNSDYISTDTTVFAHLGIRAKLISIGLTGHYPMIEQPDRFNKAIDQAVQYILEP